MVGDQVPYLCPEPLPRPPEALFCSPEPQLTIFMPREGVGVALGAQVRPLVTYRDPRWDPTFTPFLPKSVKNGAKRGYPPIFDQEIQCTT